MEEHSVDDYILDSMNVAESSLSAFDITNISLNDDDSTVDMLESFLNSSFASTSSSVDSVQSILDSSSTTAASCSSEEELLGGAQKSQSVHPDEQYLYESSKLTVFQSYLLIMKYALRHGLTKQALSDLLNLVGMHLPESSMISLYRYMSYIHYCPRGLLWFFIHRLRKFFLNLYEDISFTKHCCCSVCHRPIGADSDGRCKNGCDGTSLSFLTIAIEAQLRRKIEGT